MAHERKIVDFFGIEFVKEYLTDRSVVNNDGCLLWTGHLNRGYGQISFRLKKKVLRVAAHRLAYLVEFGLIDPKLTIDHQCNNPQCVNPSHLKLVTIRENNARSQSPSALNAAKEYCPRGHLLETPNLVPSRLKRGKRECLTCSRAYRSVRLA